MDNELMKKMITALGATSYILQNDESLSSAFTNNKIQAAENNLLNYSVSAQAPHYLIDGHLRIPEILIASDAVRSKVGESDWTIIEECARSTMSWEFEHLATREAEILSELKTEGSSVKVKEIEPNLRATLKGKMETEIYTKFEESCGELVDRIELITSGSN